MKTLILFSNDNRLEEITNIDFVFDRENFIKKIINDINIFLISDNLQFNTVQNFLSKNNIKDDEDLYVVLHKNAQNKELNEQFKNVYKNPYIITRSHTNGSIYESVIPKIFDNTLTEKDFLSFFSSKLNTALNILHRIYNGVEIKEILEDEKITEEFKGLIQKHFPETEKYQDTEEHRKKLAELRDEILKEALENEK